MPSRTPSIAFATIFAEAGALWRSERELLIPVAGVFCFLPLLGTVMLLSSSGIFDGKADPDAMREALSRLVVANAAWLIVGNVLTSFGSFVTLNIFLQGNGRSLGEVMLVSLRRFPQYFLIDFLLWLAMNLGLGLFLVPSVFAFCRGWLAGAAYADAPERGVLDAAARGWRQSGGWNWAVVLVAALAVLAVTAAVVEILAVSLTGLGVAFGAPQPFKVASLVAVTLLATAAWIAFQLVRVAIYRSSLAKQGI